MKKIDKIVFKAFIGPFILTMLVVTFILLTQHMLKYFDDLVGKDLGWDVLGKLIFYFAIFVTPFAFPLGVLLSSLMSFGNLGEHSELTAIKSGGISLPRAMRSIFIFVFFLTGIAYISNNYFVPKAALEAYSLMWDIKRKKPSLDLPEGEFYGGIENFRIKVGEKLEDGETLIDVIIYDHSDRSGNNEVTIADSGRMTSFMNDRYLRLELFNGHSFAEGTANQDNVSRSRNDLRNSFTKAKFDKSEMLLDLSSFDLERTDKQLFRKNRLMRNTGEIEVDLDSMDSKIRSRLYELYLNRNLLFDFFFRYDSIALTPELKRHQVIVDSMNKVTAEKLKRKDSTEQVLQKDSTTDQIAIKKYKEEQNKKRNIKRNNLKKIQELSENDKVTFIGKDSSAIVIPDTAQMIADIKKIINLEPPFVESGFNKSILYDQVLQRLRTAKNRVGSDATYKSAQEYEQRVFKIQYHKILANSFACIVMFLIGAPLGAIIKKGGLGFPVLLSILFFIIYYVLIIMGEKWAKNDLIYPWYGIWQANIFLLPAGLYFLYQARKDARLFEVDFYNVLWGRLQKRLKGKKTIPSNNQSS